MAALAFTPRNRNSAINLELDSTSGGLKFLKGLIPVNGTSEYYLAYSVGVGYAARTFSIKAAYKHINPNYQSMGAYFFQNDLHNISLTPSFNVLQGWNDNIYAKLHVHSGTEAVSKALRDRIVRL